MPPKRGAKRPLEESDANPATTPAPKAKHLADHAYGNLEGSMKASGCGDTDEPFQAMDKCMLELIATLREELPEEKGEFVLKLATEDMGTEFDAEWAALNRLKKNGHPNKQERGCLDRARVSDMNDLFDRRRERRGTILKEKGDWAGNALNELAETRKRIEAYGIGKHFFRRSIKQLAELKGGKAPDCGCDYDSD
ncbi:hypothetical protein QBC34DRAFT_442751 [Podospora aff. communis PSN243]|uniref:Uncharacterized protein n=1 Tax=Podospora aff. communis PSN243 TaxID=3040156 RepID=A0AAV9G9K5_9PEZI|nr:hypothetical protein QBC34DRAFT_442751 [Podospora aff. communis PSN243]